MTLAGLLVPTYRNMLNALSGWLDKAQAQVPDAEALLSARLAPDMFPLSTQVRFACVQAYEGVHRLEGKPFPTLVGELLNEGRNAGEQPGTLAAAQTRIADAVAFLQGVELDSPEPSPGSLIAHELANGMVFDLTAEQYARDWALGQFYFHVMIAYAILRSRNVEIGKADYIPHILPYLRPGG